MKIISKRTFATSNVSVHYGTLKSPDFGHLHLLHRIIGFFYSRILAIGIGIRFRKSFITNWSV